MHHDPSDLGSLILIRIIPKERTLELLTELLNLNTYFTSKIGNAFRLQERANCCSNFLSFCTSQMSPSCFQLFVMKCDSNQNKTVSYLVAVHQYWRSLRDDRTRKTNKKKLEEHRLKVKQQNRLKRVSTRLKPCKHTCLGSFVSATYSL